MRLKNLFFTIIFLSLLTGCNSIQLESKWRNNDITIDGAESDWNISKISLVKEDITIGTMNDDDYLYIFISSTNRAVKNQIMRQGLIVWLNPKGNKDKNFGIKFPVGMQGSRMPMFPPMSPDKMNPDEMNRDRNKPNPEEQWEMFKKNLDKVEIITPDDEDFYEYDISDIKGIELKIDEAKNKLIYELKVPLIRNESNPYGIGTKRSEIIGIGLETPKREKREERGFRINMGGGIGGERMGEGRMPPSGRGGMGPRMEETKPLNVWLVLKLPTKE